MGAWGYGLFQSDADLDICDDISSEAAKLAKEPELELFRPKDPAATVKKLNAGLFNQLLTDFEAVKWDHGVIYLGALAMQLGAHITIAQIAMMHKTLTRTPMYDDAKVQIQKGLDKYKNDGNPYDFESPGVIETMGKAFEKDTGKPKEDPRPIYWLNVIQDWGKMPQPKPKPASKDNQLPKREGKRAEEPTGKDGLGDKGTLKSWLESIGEGASV